MQRIKIPMCFTTYKQLIKRIIPYTHERTNEEPFYDVSPLLAWGTSVWARAMATMRSLAQVSIIINDSQKQTERQRERIESA